MEASAVSHGAATIICAFATGRGGALGINLKTKATAELDGSGEITAAIVGQPDESTLLLESCARRVLEYFRMDYGVDIRTESNIPIASGLKSSSTAANAAVLALSGAIAREHGQVIGRGNSQKLVVKGRTLDHETLIKLGVKAAFDAKVTITGAYDDATASYFGGYTVTDNLRRKIIRRGRIKPLKAVVFVPEGRSYSGKVDVKRVKTLKKEIGLAWETAKKGDIFTAMTLNGLYHTLLFKQNPEVTLEALNAGAVAAGLSGTGPSVVALARNPKPIVKSWKQFDGSILTAETNNLRASVL
ncbi:MAG: shikimate kinase [Candidatus Altiarchaeota archaeon]